LAPRNPQYWLDKLAHRKTGFPLATIAFYGEDDKVASKVVVGILLAEKEEVAFMEKWFQKSMDVRLDPEIKAQIVDFLVEHDVHRVAMMNRIIGCPHEEGIDYPEGEKCPHCPFWADRDRWSGEIIS
jgi:hypothetical protein